MACRAVDRTGAPPGLPLGLTVSGQASLAVPGGSLRSGRSSAPSGVGSILKSAVLAKVAAP